MTDDSAPIAWAAEQYQLLDFGRGRKLERFGRFVLDRPCPAAASAVPAQSALWRLATARLSGRGRVTHGETPEPWMLTLGSIRLELKLTPFGHVGVFPEQVEIWSWLDQHVTSRRARQLETRVLHLFAYTGAGSLIAAAAGARVTHVDASAPAVAWARRNARLSQLQDAPIRWIVEDARKYVQRERRRERRYDVIVLDPPSFGHGPSGKRWEIERDLAALVEQCVHLLDRPGAALLLAAHSEKPTMREMADYLSACLPESHLEYDRLVLHDLSSRQLDAGYHIRASQRASV